MTFAGCVAAGRRRHVRRAREHRVDRLALRRTEVALERAARILQLVGVVTDDSEEPEQAPRKHTNVQSGMLRNPAALTIMTFVSPKPRSSAIRRTLAISRGTRNAGVCLAPTENCVRLTGAADVILRHPPGNRGHIHDKTTERGGRRP